MANKIYIEPPESERKYRRLAALGKKLGVPIPQVFLEMEVTMPDGKVVHHHKQRSHSWVRNAYNLLFIQLGVVDAPDNTHGAGKLNVKDTGGVVVFGAQPLGTSANSSNLAAGSGYTRAAGDVTAGILVGSGANVESFEDYVLQIKILNGNGAGQLAYALSDAYAVAYVPGTLTMSVIHTRYMNNNSPGDVLVREVALVVHGFKWVTDEYWVQSRDHIATVTIPATGQLKVTYTISLVYPA